MILNTVTDTVTVIQFEYSFVLQLISNNYCTIAKFVPLVRVVQLLMYSLKLVDVVNFETPPTLKFVSKIGIYYNESKNIWEKCTCNFA